MSNIVNINNVDVSQIDPNEVFALDTNVLYWTHYSHASASELKALPYQVKKYPHFIEALLDNGNTLVTTVLNISELNHVVENSEWKIYNALNKSNINKKMFRKIELKRFEYKNEMESIMFQLKTTYGNQIKVIEISEYDINNYIANINNNACDIFDYIIICKLKLEGVVNYITDDKDFFTVDGINVYTARS